MQSQAGQATVTPPSDEFMRRCRARGERDKQLELQQIMQTAQGKVGAMANRNMLLRNVAASSAIPEIAAEPDAFHQDLAAGLNMIQRSGVQLLTTMSVPLPGNFQRLSLPHVRIEFRLMQAGNVAYVYDISRRFPAPGEEESAASHYSR
ncbi:hypothetical protein WJX72_008257 [[Myrmecia] bisecta]|uniref:Uncharacterized protein n=1 Tax=[Myrmecia] bisecta TaxID=41462 RepID=A0AAW1PM37_9CHLO